ncbi:MAG: hypothetical protein LBB61_06485 [Treponema sp.]|nr:hypothetical protein [Treponema sp.]
MATGDYTKGQCRFKVGAILREDMRASTRAAPPVFAATASTKSLYCTSNSPYRPTAAGAPNTLP